MNVVKPMLAKPLPDGFVPQRGRHVAEKKYDGHRLLVRIGVQGAPGSPFTKTLEAWSRLGNDSMRKLSTEMKQRLYTLPACCLDGELVVNTGGQSSDVATKDNIDNLVFVVFDILEAGGVSVCNQSYQRRRALLEDVIFTPTLTHSLFPHVGLAEVHQLNTREDLDDLAEEVWIAGGEGLIVKNTLAVYRPGKRSDAFMKVKKCEHGVITIIEWDTGTTPGECVAVGKDDEGIGTRAKILDDATRARVRKDPQSFIGRRLCIEYTERTPDGGYRHPRWDRFEDE